MNENFNKTYGGFLLAWGKGRKRIIRIKRLLYLFIMRKVTNFGSEKRRAMFSKSCKYAIRAVLYMAAHSTTEQRLGVKEISEALDVPRPFLAKLLQQLSRNNLVSSIKGPHGGFFLNEKNRNEPLRKVVECIDGPEVFSACILGLPVCSSENPCPLHAQAYIYREGLLHMVGKKTIAEIALQVSREELSL